MRRIALSPGSRGLARRFVWLLCLCAAMTSCSLFSMLAEDDREAQRKQQQALDEQAALQRKQAEQAAQKRELAGRMVRLRTELQAERDVVRNAVLFARAVSEHKAQGLPST